MAVKPPHLIHPNYRPDIDGLRAVAVMSVVGYHAFPGRVQGGFIGVDIFFVISGFLISTIIFSSLERDRFSIVEFYIRRVRRIFPALIVVMLATFVFGWYVLLADEFAQLGKHIAGGVGFVSNFILWNESGYFDHAAVTKPLLHLWSLGIEEQFYIFWPLLLAFVWKRHRSFLRVTALIAVISFVVNIYLVNTDPVASFYSPASRFWELMVGGILAYITLHRPHLLCRYKNAQSVLGFSLIAAGLILLGKASAFPGWWALLPVMGAFFIISAGSSAWLNDKILSGRVMVWIGLVSYPLYLWHWPLLTYANILEDGTVTREYRIAGVVLSVFLAWLTYRYIESPIRFGRRRKRIVLALLMMMSVMFIVGLVGYKALFLPRNNNPSLTTIIAATKDWDYPGRLTPFDPEMIGSYIKKSERQEITLFMGDSHMEQYAPRVVRDIQDHPSTSNTALFVTWHGCVFIPGVIEDPPLHGGRCGELRDYALHLMHQDTVKTVVLGGAWNMYFYYLQDYSFLKYHYYFLDHGERVSLYSKRGVHLAQNSLEGLLKMLSKTKKVYLLLDNPVGKQYDPRAFFSGSRLGGYVGNGNMSDYTPVDLRQLSIRDALVEVAERLGIAVIDPHMCMDGRCLRAYDGNPTHMDREHLRASITREYATYIDRSLHEP